MARRKQIYEGKAKILYEGPEPGTVIQYFKDDNKNLLNNIEDLFADMISIAQIFREKETKNASDDEKRKRDLTDMQSKLQAERQKSGEIEDGIESLRRENEKLHPNGPSPLRHRQHLGWVGCRNLARASATTRNARTLGRQGSLVAGFPGGRARGVSDTPPSSGRSRRG